MNSSTIRNLFLILTCAVTGSLGQIYVLETSYSGTSFLEGFDFFTGSDPTHGFVTYIDREPATSQGLVSTSDGVTHIGVDHTSVLSPDGPGRKSVRISSKETWTHGLFIADITHMPGTICGLWPAFWTLGNAGVWPVGGEIDIIEGVNSAAQNLMTLHTTAECQVTGSNQLGTLQTSNCDGSTNYNAGCGTSASDPRSYGTPFNDNGGGVYAMEWTSTYIRVWFFPRDSIPSDIEKGTPTPSSAWGLPQANFQGCDIDSHFSNHQIVFDATFCGDWAGNQDIWEKDDTCSAKADTCVDYVAGNPSDFAEAYWDINSVNVYQLVKVKPHHTITKQVAMATQASDSASQAAASQSYDGENADLQYLSQDSASQAETDSNLDQLPAVQSEDGTHGIFYEYPGYLPSAATTPIPENLILGKARGGCGCSADSETTHTTTTTSLTVFVNEVSCTDTVSNSNDKVLEYGSMMPMTSTTSMTTYVQVSKTEILVLTGCQGGCAKNAGCHGDCESLEPTRTACESCENGPSQVQSSYVQVSSGAAKGGVEVSGRLGGVGLVLGFFGVLALAL